MSQKPLLIRSPAWSGLVAYGFIWLLALVLRLVFLWQIRNTDVFTLLMGDAGRYDAWAQEITRGNWLGHQVFYQAPLYPYFMASIYAMFGRHLLLLRLMQAVIGATSCVLLARAGGSFLSRKAGLCAGVLLAVYPTAIFFDCSIQKSVLDLFFICALLAGLGRLGEQPSGRGWLAAGAVLGLLTLTRENALVFLPVILLWLFAAWRGEPWRKRLRWAGLLLLGLGLVLLPVGGRNRFVGGEFHLTTAQFGPNFYIGNSRNATGFYHPLVWGHGSVKFEQDDATKLAEQATGRQLTPGEVSRYWTSLALADIREDPARWLSLMGNKLLSVWNVSEVGDTDDQYTYGEWSALLRMLSCALHFGTICPLAILGICLTWSQRKRLWLLYGMLLAYAGSVVLFYVFARYRFPLVPLLLLFSAGGLTCLCTAFRARPARMAVLGVALAVAVAVICNQPAVSESDIQGTTRFNIAVELLIQRTDVDGAIVHCAEAVRLKPGFAPAHHELAVLLLRKGRTQEAMSEDLQALSLHPDYLEAHDSLGGALISLGKYDEAASHIAAALQLDPDDADAHHSAARLFAQQGKLGEALSQLQIALKLNPDSPETQNDLGVTLMRMGKFDEAAPHVAAALRLNPDYADAHYNAALLFAQQGNLVEALSQLQSALKLNPSSKPFREKFEELQRLEAQSGKP